MSKPKGTIRKIADESGLSQTTVRRALEGAGMSELRAGEDFTKAVEIARNWADSDRVLGHFASGRGEGGNRASSAYSDAKAQSELHRARKLELQNAVLEGSLIDRQSVTDTGARIIAEVRTTLLSLGHRIAPNVVGKTDQREVAQIIETAIRDALGSLSDEKRFFAALEADALS